MNEVTRLIEVNEDKFVCLKKYSDCNDMMLKMLEDRNLSALKNIRPKKSALISSMKLLDDKLVDLVEALKAKEEISDLSELDTTKYEELKRLKDISLSVLRLTLEVKKQDEVVAEKLDSSFEEYRTSKSKVNTNKLESFTKDYFES